jgi:transposase
MVRWALYEAAKTAARPASPYHDYYLSVAERLTKKEATLSVARVITKQAAQILRDLGDQATAPWEG